MPCGPLPKTLAVRGAKRRGASQKARLRLGRPPNDLPPDQHALGLGASRPDRPDHSPTGAIMIRAILAALVLGLVLAHTTTKAAANLAAYQIEREAQ